MKGPRDFYLEDYQRVREQFGVDPNQGLHTLTSDVQQEMIALYRLKAGDNEALRGRHGAAYNAYLRLVKEFADAEAAAIARLRAAKFVERGFPPLPAAPHR